MQQLKISIYNFSYNMAMENLDIKAAFVCLLYCVSMFKSTIWI